MRPAAFLAARTHLVAIIARWQEMCQEAGQDAAVTSADALPRSLGRVPTGWPAWGVESPGWVIDKARCDASLE